MRNVRDRKPVVSALVVLSCCALSVFTFAVATTAVAAEPPDHLRCRRVQTPREPRRQVELRTELGLHADCVVRGAAREICEPVYDEAGGTRVAASGVTPEPAVQRVCYRVRCRSGHSTDLVVSDRFGARAVTIGVPATVCTPIDSR